MDPNRETPQPAETTTIIDNTSEVHEPLNTEKTIHSLQTQQNWYRVGFFALLLVLIFSLTGNAYLVYYMNHVDNMPAREQDTRQADNGLRPPEGAAAVTDAPLPMQPESTAGTAPAAAQPTPIDTAGWQSYASTEANFSLLYPNQWTKTDLTNADGTPRGITLDGPEGALTIVWGNGFGGVCAGETVPVTIRNGSLEACKTSGDDGSEVYGQMEKSLSPDLAVSADATVKSDVAAHKPVVMTVLSTLQFAAGP
jgi:hypothetical protein